MDRETEARLVEFCAVQARHFDEQAWVNASGSSDEAFSAGKLAAAAALLASASWYGHRSQMQSVLDRLVPDRAQGALAQVVRASGLSPARFTAMVQSKLLLNLSRSVREMS